MAEAGGGGARPAVASEPGRAEPRESDHSQAPDDPHRLAVNRPEPSASLCMVGGVAAPALRPLGIGEILDVSLKLSWRNLGTLVRIVVFVVAPAQLLIAIVDVSAIPNYRARRLAPRLDERRQATVQVNQVWTTLAAELVALVVGFVASEFATAACFRTIAESYLGSGSGWRSSLAFAARKFRSVLWIALLGFVLSARRQPLLLHPGDLPLRLVRGRAAGPDGEGQRGSKALGRSRALVRGRWWKTAITLFVGALLVLDPLERDLGTRRRAQPLGRRGRRRAVRDHRGRGTAAAIVTTPSPPPTTRSSTSTCASARRPSTCAARLADRRRALRGWLRATRAAPTRPPSRRSGRPRPAGSRRPAAGASFRPTGDGARHRRRPVLAASARLDVGRGVRSLALGAGLPSPASRAPPQPAPTRARAQVPRSPRVPSPTPPRSARCARIGRVDGERVDLAAALEASGPALCGAAAPPRRLGPPESARPAAARLGAPRRARSSASGASAGAPSRGRSTARSAGSAASCTASARGLRPRLPLPLRLRSPAGRAPSGSSSRGGRGVRRGYVALGLGRRRARTSHRRAAARPTAPADDPRRLERAGRRGRTAAASTSGRSACASAPGLLRLALAAVIPPRTSLTNGEIARRLGSGSFRGVAADFDEVVYGGRAASSEDAARARAGWERVLEETRPR